MKKIEFRDVTWPHDAGPGGFSLDFIKSVYTPIATFVVSALKQLRISSFIINFKCVVLVDDKTEAPLFKGRITGRADGDAAAISVFELNVSSNAPSCKKEFCVVKVADGSLSTRVLDAVITFNYSILSPEPDEDELEALNYALKSAISTCLDKQVGPIVPQEMAF